MLKFPPELIVRRGNVFYLLYVAGGLLMTVTAGSLCVDAAVRTAQDPAKLLHLSNKLIGLMGLRHQICVANSLAKRKRKRLHLTESLNSLLDVTRAAQHGSPDFMRLIHFPGSPERRMILESTSVNCISAKRWRIYYILIRGAGSRPIVTLCVGDNSSKLKTYSPSNQLQWLVDFSRKAQERGDVIVLLVGGQINQISSEPQRNDAKNERYPTRLTLGLSALSVVLLWMCLPHIAVCAVVLLSWKLQQHIT
ncbi:uncharacterized protein [Trachinotus anak]|uniref:uncharacterized protein n=1 Tax=Trachinotus anak TaxID=443729 RepID=UPI0039F1F8DF